MDSFQLQSQFTYHHIKSYAIQFYLLLITMYLINSWESRKFCFSSITWNCKLKFETIAIFLLLIVNTVFVLLDRHLIIPVLLLLSGTSKLSQTIIQLSKLQQRIIQTNQWVSLSAINCNGYQIKRKEIDTDVKIWFNFNFQFSFSTGWVFEGFVLGEWWFLYINKANIVWNKTQ